VATRSCPPRPEGDHAYHHHAGAFSCEHPTARPQINTRQQQASARSAHTKECIFPRARSISADAEIQPRRSEASARRICLAHGRRDLWPRRRVISGNVAVTDISRDTAPILAQIRPRTSAEPRTPVTLTISAAHILPAPRTHLGLRSRKSPSARPRASFHANGLAIGGLSGLGCGHRVPAKTVSQGTRPNHIKCREPAGLALRCQIEGIRLFFVHRHRLSAQR